MCANKYDSSHHTDNTSKWVASIIVILVAIASAVGLSLNESSKTEKKIVKSQALVDSLSHEIEWRQQVLVHHDSLQTLVSDAKNFRKLPARTRQEISAALAASSSKITSTKHNLQILQDLLDKEKQTLATLQENKLYKIYHPKK
ncbi:hypothetical protein JW998_02210 [candidate division KSB1 bacterium]|nr:hypothetical protein [candidate division KSB1 bacterium]